MVTAVTGLLDKFIPDKDAREKAANEISLALIQQQQVQDTAQSQVNAVEAANPNIFVSGWRPAIGWVCGFALCWKFVGYPILSFALAASGHPAALPDIPTDNIFELVLAMLGLGGLRTFEKLRGVAR